MKVWEFDYYFTSAFPVSGIERLAKAETFEEALQIFRKRLKEIDQQNFIILSLKQIGDAAGLVEESEK